MKRERAARVPRVKVAKQKVAYLLSTIPARRQHAIKVGKMIGDYNAKARIQRLALHRHKRKNLNFNVIKYLSRKALCNQRARSGGRFVAVNENRPQRKLANIFAP